MSRRRWSAILLSCASRQRDDVERQIRGIVNTESGDVNAPRSATTFIGQFPPNQLRKRVFEDSTGDIVSRARTIADPVEPVCSGGVDRAKRAAPRPPSALISSGAADLALVLAAASGRWRGRRHGPRPRGVAHVGVAAGIGAELQAAPPSRSPTTVDRVDELQTAG